MAERPDPCAICLEEIELQPTYPCSNCQTGYHDKCIGTWMDVKTDCPTCRQQLPTSVVIEIRPEAFEVMTREMYEPNAVPQIIVIGGCFLMMFIFIIFTIVYGLTTNQ